jgi:hypothetical protein
MIDRMAQNKVKDRESLFDALQSRKADSRIKTAAFYFLRADWGRLETAQDFAKAYDGLQACIQILGPLGADYLKSLEAMRKALESLSAERVRWTNAEFTAVTREIFPRILEVLRGQVSPDVLASIKGLFASITKG